MDKRKNQPKPQVESDQKVKDDLPLSLEEQVTFTDKKRKREEIDQSTIGGF